MLLTNTLVDVTRKTKERTNSETQVKLPVMHMAPQGNRTHILWETSGPASGVCFQHPLTCRSVHKTQRCGLWGSGSADGQLLSPSLASGFSGSLLQPLHSELSEKSRAGQV